MIENKDILAPCDHFERYLLPRNIHMRRLPYNGNTFMSTYDIGRQMGIADETVRTVQNRALDALAHCLIHPAISPGDTM